MARLLTISAITFVLCAGMLRADGTATPFFMELQPTEMLPRAVGGAGWVSVGALMGGGGFYWMPNTGKVDLGGTAAAALSRDGQTIVGNALDAQGRENAAIWTNGQTWRLLGSFSRSAQPCDRDYSSAYGTSADAKVIVGLAWDGCRFARAFRWDEETGVVNLGSLSGRSTRANNISGDAHVIVGWEEHATGPRMGVKWVDSEEQLITTSTGTGVGEAFAVNRDGSIITGANCTGFHTTIPTGWVWTSNNGVHCFPVERPAWLPPLPYSVLMQATSDDGLVIGGAYSFGLDSEALIWLDGQVYFLRDYLRSNGVPDAFRGWVNTGFITAVTPDGRTLVGYGAGPTGFQGYMVVLPDRGKR
jgi:probable HAF family extracellular repeat protein